MLHQPERQKCVNYHNGMPGLRAVHTFHSGSLTLMIIFRARAPAD